MTYRICYWDAVSKSQKERDSTPAEDAQMAADILANSALSSIPLKKSDVEILKDALLFKGVLTTQDLVPK